AIFQHCLAEIAILVPKIARPGLDYCHNFRCRLISPVKCLVCLSTISRDIDEQQGFRSMSIAEIGFTLKLEDCSSAFACSIPTSTPKNGFCDVIAI
ncbi:MAG: hypothetical protein EA370_18110, partial [Wenzhouxiangella sp.]